MTAPDRIRITSYGVDDVSGAATGQKLAIHAGTEYIRADLAAVPAHVRVNPLVWEEQDGKSYRQANSIVGQYQVAWLCEFECWQLSKPHRNGDEWRNGFSRHSSKDAAKAAAQADYAARILAAIEPQPAPDALHRSFPDAGDGRQMPPMGDELMTAGLSVEDARFVAVQLAQNGLMLTAQPDPRDEVIARLVEALHANVVCAEKIADAVEIDPDETFLRVKVMPGGREVATRSWSEVLSQARAALAAAKAVQK